MKIIAALFLFAFAASAPGADDGFAKWWPEFKSSVTKSDAKAMVHGSTFPMEWELGKVRKIDTEADFILHFNTYFMADMRRAVLTQKPIAIPGNKYMILWHARGDEYSLYFKSRGGSWALDGLSEGPI
jgi:hypothetical protein